MEILDDRSKNRAVQALRCLSFNSTFYAEIRTKGLNAVTVFEKQWKYSDGSKWYRRPGFIESDFSWLIKVGILRREVDGQGLTSRVKLTPMGRQIIDRNPYIPDQKAGFIVYLNYLFKRNLIFR